MNHDYDNATLAGLPACLLNRLQSVIHAAARSIAGLRRSEHITDAVHPQFFVICRFPVLRFTPSHLNSISCTVFDEQQGEIENNPTSLVNSVTPPLCGISRWKSWGIYFLVNRVILASAVLSQYTHRQMTYYNNGRALQPNSRRKTSIKFLACNSQ